MTCFLQGKGGRLVHIFVVLFYHAFNYQDFIVSEIFPVPLLELGYWC